MSPSSIQTSPVAPCPDEGQQTARTVANVARATDRDDVKMGNVVRPAQQDLPSPRQRNHVRALVFNSLAVRQEVFTPAIFLHDAETPAALHDRGAWRTEGTYSRE